MPLNEALASKMVETWDAAAPYLEHLERDGLIDVVQSKTRG